MSPQLSMASLACQHSGSPWTDQAVSSFQRQHRLASVHLIYDLLYLETLKCEMSHFLRYYWCHVLSILFHNGGSLCYVDYSTGLCSCQKTQIASKIDYWPSLMDICVVQRRDYCTRKDFQASFTSGCASSIWFLDFQQSGTIDSNVSFVSFS